VIRVASPFRLLAVVGLVASMLLSAAGSARADGPSALEQLSPDERARLAEKVPGWHDLDRARQERIAENLLRVRRLPPEERERLTRRIEQLRRHREERKGPPRGRHGDFRDPKRRRDLMHRGILVRATGYVLWDNVAPDAKEAFRNALGSKAARYIEMTFFRRLWEALIREKAAAGIPDIEMSEETPEGRRRQVERLKQEAEAGSDKARLRLAHFAVSRDLHELTRRVMESGKIDEAMLRRVGANLKERHPEVFEAARVELEEVATDPKALERYVYRAQGSHGRGGHGRRPPGPGASMEERARHLRDAIEHAKPLFRRYPTLREPAVRLRQALETVLRGDAGHQRRGPPPGRRPGGRRGPGRERPPAPPPTPPKDDR
jgi:hypothetical protein